jgi:hypothetical protein
MTQRHRFTFQIAGALTGAALFLAASTAQASTLQTIYQSTSGGDHLIGTFANADGSVFVVSDVGQNGRGQILLLTPKHKTYTMSIVKEFACDSDGEQPDGNLVADASGNVWGMTNTGCGDSGNPDGTLFELVKPAKGKKWTFRTAVQMPASIGYEGVFGSGYGHMAFDDLGNLYGIEALGCNDGSCGKIYEVPVTLLGSGKPKGKVKILYSFPEGPNQTQPNGLVRDKNGNFFGVTYGGGAHSLGTAWEVSPPKRTNRTWTGRNIYDFCSNPSFDNCDDGFNPAGLPVLDANGVLYGTTFGGGPNFAFGTVWSLTPTPNGKSWAFRQIHTFSNAGSGCPNPTQDYGVDEPVGSLALNSAGQLLTLTSEGGIFSPCNSSQSVINGGLVSIDPVGGGDTIVNSQFSVLGHIEGPGYIESGISMLGDTVFGTSQQYDSGADTVTPGVVFKITP